ncbi:MAG: MerR family transcriptional regulator [Treponema sp.]|jgi:DNA-binding transcriptional MerR regulator|nr:MerR family transcriptional regulator [Treponema sp.]
MTIAEVIDNTGLSTTDTRRYYERIGLFPPVMRNRSGIRNYSETDCLWIGFIKGMRAAGIPVGVLLEYVSLFQQGRGHAGNALKTCYKIANDDTKRFEDEKIVLRAALT